MKTIPSWRLGAAIFGLALLPLLFPTPATAAPESDKAKNRWEPEICKFEALDKETPPPKGGLLFVGSSTIRLWDLKKSFPELPALNRGFGGSTLADLNYYRDRVVLPYAPKTIVLYSGDNDIAGGASAEDVFQEFRNFAEWTRENLPNTRIIALSIKPTVARWKLWDVMRETNRKISDYAATSSNVTSVDCSSVVLGNDGQPRKELLRADGLHLNEAGYAEWARILTPVLKAKPSTP